MKVRGRVEAIRAIRNQFADVADPHKRNKLIKRAMQRSKIKMSAVEEVFTFAKKDNKEYTKGDKAKGYLAGTLGAAGVAKTATAGMKPGQIDILKPMGKRVKMLGKRSNIYQDSAAAVMGGGGAYVQRGSRRQQKSLAARGFAPDSVNISGKFKGALRRDILGHELGHRKNARALARKIGVKNARRAQVASGLGFMGGSALGTLATATAKDDKSAKRRAAASTALMAPRLIDEAAATGRVIRRNRLRGLKTSKRMLAGNIGSYGAVAAAPWVARSIMKRSKKKRESMSKKQKA